MRLLRGWKRRPWVKRFPPGFRDAPRSAKRTRDHGRDDDDHPTPKATQQAGTGALRRMPGCSRERRDHPGWTIGFGTAADPDDPQRGDGAPQPQPAARAGSVILVGSPCHPPRFTSLKPPAMMGRSPSQTTSAGAGTRSVRISPGAVWSSSPQARNGPARRDVGPDKQGARPPHPAFPCCTVWTGGRKAAAPSAR